MNSTYSMGHHTSVLRSHQWRTVSNSAAYLRPHLTPGQRVLDVGCGPGTITHELASIVGNEGLVVGVDSSAEVIALAANTAPEAARGEQLRFEVADVEQLDFPDNYFDIVHAHQVLQHLTDPVTALKEMARVLRRGGIIAVREADYDAMTWFPQPPGMDQWLTTHQVVARLNGAEPNAGRRLLAWAHEAGLDDVIPSASVWCFANDEGRAWWGGLQADRIVESDVARQALAAQIATSEQLQKMSKGWRSWAAHPSAWFAVLHGEIIARPPAPIPTGARA